MHVMFICHLIWSFQPIEQGARLLLLGTGFQAWGNSYETMNEKEWMFALKKIISWYVWIYHIRNSKFTIGAVMILGGQIPVPRGVDMKTEHKSSTLEKPWIKWEGSNFELSDAEEDHFSIEGNVDDWDDPKWQPCKRQNGYILVNGRCSVNTDYDCSTNAWPNTIKTMMASIPHDYVFNPFSCMITMKREKNVLYFTCLGHKELQVQCSVPK